jgi:hypothetical protein
LLELDRKRHKVGRSARKQWCLALEMKSFVVPFRAINVWFFDS